VIYAPFPEAEGRIGVDEEGVGGRPRSLRWVGVRGISSMVSGGAQKGRSELDVASTSNRRSALRERYSRLVGRGVRDSSERSQCPGAKKVLSKMRLKTAVWKAREVVKMLASRRRSISRMRGCVHVPVGGDGAAGSALCGVDGVSAVVVAIFNWICKC